MVKHNLLEPTNIVTEFVAEEIFQSNKETLEKVQDDLRNRIKNKEKITERMLWEAFGFDYSHIPFPDERLDCYGWDKKGYHKLYEIGLVPIKRRKRKDV